MEDTELTCAACGGTFLFSASEQAYYAERGFQLPKRCRACRQSGRRKAGGGGGAGAGGARRGGRASSGSLPRQRDLVTRRAYPVTCRDCGEGLKVPFPPRDTAIRCRPCFAKQYAG